MAGKNQPRPATKTDRQAQQRRDEQRRREENDAILRGPPRSGLPAESTQRHSTDNVVTVNEGHVESMKTVQRVQTESKKYEKRYKEQRTKHQY